MSSLQRIRTLRKRLGPGLRLYLASPWVNRSHVSRQSPIIVGGCDRSGTTLLRAAIDSHPDVAGGPESWLFTYRPNFSLLAEDYGFEQATIRRWKDDATSLGEFIEHFMSEHARREGVERWCEKSPANVTRLDFIWKRFPEARVVHIIRDGRDVACSLRNHPRQVRVGERYVPNDIERPIAECIDWWSKYVRAGLRHRGDERYMEVRYEDLVLDHADTLRRICDHCHLDWSTDLLRREEIQGRKEGLEIVNPEVRGPLYHSTIGRWRKDLSDDEIATCARRAGGLLEELDYLTPHSAKRAAVPTATYDPRTA